MLSAAALRRRLEVLRDPLSLCDQLELRPTPRQREVLGVLASNPSFYQVVGDDRNEMARAAAIYALWRILSSPSSRGILLASDFDAAGRVMSFLEQVTKKINPNLASVTGFPYWNVLRIGGQPSWELQLMENKAQIVAQRAPNSVLSVIFGDRSSDPAFREAVSALEEHSTHPKHTRIVVW
jgi:hypothetical protein